MDYFTFQFITISYQGVFMNRKMLTLIIIGLFMLTCIASVNADDVNASDNDICLDNDDCYLSSSIMGSPNQDFSKAEDKSPNGGGSTVMLIP